MTFRMNKLGLGFVILTAIVCAGCAANIGLPQTRDEFVAMYKPGGMFRNAEHVTVSRPFKSVVADVTEYAKKCLNVRETHAPSYQYKEAGGSTTYRPKIESIKGGGVSLSLQEKYNDRVDSGAPPGGIFILVAEMRAIGGSKTQLDIYHASRGKAADSLKQWAEGDSRICPSFERGW